MPEKGLLNIEDLKRMAASGEMETVILGFTDHYGRLVGKRFDIDFFLSNGATEGTHGCDYLLTVDMDMDPVPGYSFANWELGYGDFHLVPDMRTLRHASWLEKTALVICDLIDDKTHKAVSVGPRSVLRKQLERADKLGYSAFAASELEYFLFEDSYQNAFEKGYSDLKTAGWYREDYHIMQGSRNEHFTAAARRNLKNSGIPVENSKGEWGIGQHELNIAYSEALDMADRHVIYKQCLKELADDMDMGLTFMAKYKTDGAGSSCHIHMSLWSGVENVFDGEHAVGPVKGSDVFRWFLGGWLKYTPELMPFYAPTINSYKRYQDGSWAPTRLAWSYDNRTAGFRVVGSGKSLRIECRVPGADCNPYLAYAAALASGLKGIEDQIEPPEIFEGDIYAAKDLERVPFSLEQAVDRFEKSTFAKESFGADVVKHYSHFFKQEVQSFHEAVTDWERQRYFERI